MHLKSLSLLYKSYTYLQLPREPKMMLFCVQITFIISPHAFYEDCRFVKLYFVYFGINYLDGFNRKRFGVGNPSLLMKTSC